MCNRAQMDWDDLRVVLAVARGGTLSEAAIALGVAHTTVSRRLRACEQALGVRLFDRMQDGLHPTAAGQDLAEVAERMEGEVFAVEGRIVGRDAELRGDLRISSLELLSRMCHPALASFVDRYPSVRVTITTPMDPVSLTRREADVALRLTARPPEGLVGRKVGALDFAPFASPALVERVGAAAPLAEYPWLSFDERLGHRWVDAWLKANAPGARIVARLDESTMLVRDLIEQGLGVFFLPTVEARLRGLVQLQPAAAEHSMPVWLLTLPDLRHTSRVRAFLDHMGAEVPPLLAGHRRSVS